MTKTLPRAVCIYTHGLPDQDGSLHTPKMVLEDLSSFTMRVFACMGLATVHLGSALSVWTHLHISYLGTCPKRNPCYESDDTLMQMHHIKVARVIPRV